MTFTVGDCKLARLLVHGATCSRAGTHLAIRNDIRPRSLQQLHCESTINGLGKVCSNAAFRRQRARRFGSNALPHHSGTSYFCAVCDMLGHACLHKHCRNLGPKASLLLGWMALFGSRGGLKHILDLEDSRSQWFQGSRLLKLVSFHRFCKSGSRLGSDWSTSDNQTWQLKIPDNFGILQQAMLPISATEVQLPTSWPWHAPRGNRVCTVFVLRTHQWNSLGFEKGTVSTVEMCWH